MFDRRHFLGSTGMVLAGLAAGCAAPGVRPGTGMAGSGLIDDIQKRTFQFFWDTTDPATGLAPDRWPTPSFASIAAVGFALTVYPIGVRHGWVTREAARGRTLATLNFFANAPQGPGATGFAGHKGFFYHFLGSDGRRFGRTELSTIDTSLLLGGVLFAQSYYDGDHPDEARIRDLAEQLYRAVDWAWITPRAPFVSMGWHPETGFIRSDWDIYNEGMILYVLGLASPTHPLPAEAWPRLTREFEKSWTSKWGQPHLHFGPMLAHQYSHIWIDFRGIRDPYIASKGIDYFENSRRATYAQRDYGIANPGGWDGYGADCWGWNACDGPGDFKIVQNGRTREYFSYSARGPGDRDDGTITPHAALGAIAFAPEIVEPMIGKVHARYGSAIYGKYGYLDSFNPTMTDPTAPLKHGKVVPGIGWVADDYLGLDQGPIVMMIENARSGFVWEVMRRNPHIRRGLTLAGFTGGWLA